MWAGMELGSCPSPWPGFPAPTPRRPARTATAASQTSRHLRGSSPLPMPFPLPRMPFHLPSCPRDKLFVLPVAFSLWLLRPLAPHPQLALLPLYVPSPTLDTESHFDSGRPFRSGTLIHQQILPEILGWGHWPGESRWASWKWGHLSPDLKEK